MKKTIPINEHMRRMEQFIRELYGGYMSNNDRRNHGKHALRKVRDKRRWADSVIAVF